MSVCLFHWLYGGNVPLEIILQRNSIANEGRFRGKLVCVQVCFISVWHIVEMWGKRGALTALFFQLWSQCNKVTL